MKKPLCLTTTLLFSLLLFAQQNVILILSTGQSNATGRGDNVNNYVPTGAYEWHPSTLDVKPFALISGEGVYEATYYSLNYSLAGKLNELTGNDILIMPMAIGNTDIKFWMPGAQGGEYAELLRQWNACIAYCQAHNINIVHKYIHWLQGENDASEGTSETDYYNSLNSLVSSWMNDFKPDNIFCARIGYLPSVGLGVPTYQDSLQCEQIMKAQKLLACNRNDFIISSNQSATFCCFVYGNPLNTQNYDHAHYQGHGLDLVGNDVAQAIYYYQQTGQKITLGEPVSRLSSVTCTAALPIDFEDFQITNLS